MRTRRHGVLRHGASGAEGQKRGENSNSRHQYAPFIGVADLAWQQHPQPRAIVGLIAQSFSQLPAASSSPYGRLGPWTEAPDLVSTSEKICFGARANRLRLTGTAGCR